MTYKRLGKKAAIDSTITWIGAIFVIVFILMIYLAATFLMANAKSLNGKVDVKDSEYGLSEDVSLSENLFSILNSEIEVNGKSEKVIDAVLSSFDSYLEAKDSSGSNLVDKYGLYNYNDISRTSESQMVKDGFNSDDVSKIKNQDSLLASALGKSLALHCSRFKLGIPQGLITEEGLQSGDSLGYHIYFTMKDFPPEWNKVVDYKLIYHGKEIKIEYTELKECSGGRVLNGQWD